MKFLLSGSVADWAVHLSLAVLLLWLAVFVGRVVQWIWWRPKRLERLLREQGLKGNPYRLLMGDVGDNKSMLKAAHSKSLPLFCHDIASRVLPLYSQTFKKYGKNSFIWFGPHPTIIVTSPELIREILSTKFGHFEKLKISHASKFLLSGLFDYEGEKWAMDRKIISPAFHLDKLKCMLPTFSACCSNLIDQWRELVSPEVYTEINIWPEFQRFTGDVISQTAFASYFEEGKRVFQLQDEQARLFTETVNYSFIPGYGYIPTRTNRRKGEIEREVRTLLRGIIEKREKAMKAGVKSEDLLGYLMESNSNYLKTSGSVQKFAMTIEEVIDECKLFYIAGHETTAVLLTWTMILLCMYPSWQARAREEVLQSFGKRKPNFDELNHLKIVTMIINEVLRLYPPVPFIFRCPTRDIKIGDLNVQRGVRLFLPILFTHHDPEYWGEDAHEFKPERFSEGVSKAVKSQMAFFPFSGGPRVCIGQGFAMIEAKLALCMILQNFCFELSPSYIHAPYIVITLHPQHGAPIMIRKL